ncbi:CubicO group peptidase (beta-lactamase class C family) [Arcicella aurantiaca]|uniref:CubicO group peptidase (Beta-lactamase class C family) n=1 Tax=Arcicella aurantiaca TaxID=591202 RepID=A0A316ESQ8_9BACT|nr:serine hydrolase domain-containing protein [Arcicella aurantiaca]PWK26190.1 CubicO group peptidase (beta-lactamase class C family) [Arcicella aurantiaca]
MMTPKFLFVLLFVILISPGKIFSQTALAAKIDSFLKTQIKRPFNGVILISKNGKVFYSKVQGYSNLEKKKPLVLDNQFIIGSISKQMTAVAVLREFEKGKIELHVPVRKYLPEMPQTWLDSITVHQLLNHTSGVTDWNKPLKFKPSTGFSYSNIGYELLAKIAEKVSGKSYAVLMSEIFKTCGIKNSMSPALNQHKKLVNSYVEDSTGKVKIVEGLLLDLRIPSGGMISTAKDLLLWNKNLHGGKLLSKKSYNLMTTASSSRDHFIFGKVDYGYGLQIDRKGKTLEIGHSGYATGFASANFYYPETQTNLIILENIAWDADNFKDTFKHHVEIRKILGGGIEK